MEIDKVHLEQTQNPRVFVDKETGTLYYLEFDNVSGKHYLNKLNEGKEKQIFA